MIYGIRPPNAANVGGVQTNRPQQPAKQSPATVPAPRPTHAPNAPQSASAAAVPTQAPTGTDPELWNVLSSEERVFFAKLGAMGPLTYGRVLSGQMQPPAPSVRGGRLDVKA
jgi:hypothetical protein